MALCRTSEIESEVLIEGAKYGVVKTGFFFPDFRDLDEHNCICAD